MNQFPIEIKQFPARAADASVALLGAGHGYRLEGDTVHLHAMFTVITSAAHERSWALQLWACPSAPANRAELSGHIVAHAALPPIGELADEVHSFEVSTRAFPPAGNGEHVIVLALVAGNDRESGEVHDLFVYPRPERFLHPRLRGAVSYRINDSRAEISVEKIESPRGTKNLSGTLSLELWALPSRYQGGAFQGVSLAGVAFDSLAGQKEYQSRSFDLPFTAPPAGTWQLTLMLREWTAAGYVTRDFANFKQPYVQQPAVAELPVAKAPVAEAAPAPVAEIAPAPVAEIAPAPVAEVAPAPVAEVAPAATQSRAANAAQPVGLVSINHASAAELSKVKGLPEKVAKAIIANRPFDSLDELKNIKGMGAKLLAKVRASLEL
ncbi:MAG TPA: helix-hairpin-helix domain-containing protein [Chthoniobacterales bacterium]